MIHRWDGENEENARNLILRELSFSETTDALVTSTFPLTRNMWLVPYRLDALLFRR